MFKRTENIVEISGRFRVEKGPRRVRDVATDASLDDSVTARHYKSGMPDAKGHIIKPGEAFDYIDWKQRKKAPVFTLYKLARTDAVLMREGPLRGQKLLQPRWLPESEPFQTEEEAIAHALELMGIPPSAALGLQMAYLNDRILDSGLDILDTEADRIDVCSQEPATYTEATSTYSLGNKDHGASGSAFGSPGDGDTSGRKVASTAVTDGSVTATDTATHWAVSEVGNTRLLAASSLASSVAVTSGNSFSLPSFDIELPDPS